MSNRRGADLGLTLVNLGYVAPTPASIGAAKNTDGAGLPTFAGRSVGDHHFDNVARKDLALTGVPGASVVDDFNRSNRNLAGDVTSGGTAYSGAAGSAGELRNNRVENPAGVNQFTDFVMGGGDGYISIDWFVGTYDGSNMAWLRLGTDANGFVFRVFLANGTIHIQDRTTGTDVVSGSASGIAVSTLYNLSFERVGTVVTARVTRKSDNVVVQSISYTMSSGRSATFDTGNATGHAAFQIALTATSGGYLDNLVAQGYGTLAWSNVTTAAALGSLMNFRGAWSSAASYATNDVVTSAYSLWVAVSPIAASGVSPELNPGIPGGTPAAVASFAGATAGAGNFGAGSATYEAFTVGPAPIVIDTISVVFGNGAQVLPAGARIGIATAIGANPAAGVTWLASKDVSGLVTAANTASDITLPTSVTLAANTTYYFAATGVTGLLLNYMTGVGVLTGGLASVGDVQYDFSATWTSSASTKYRVTFKVGTQTSIWKKIAHAGNQENVGQVAASGAAVTILDPEVQSITRVVLTANCVITLPAVAAGKSFTVVVVQDATGSRTLGWAGPTVLWPGGVAPTQTPTASKGDVYSFMADGGGNWLGFVGGQNY